MLQCPNAHRPEQYIRPADVPFDLHGVVMRSQLLRMLKYRIGFCQLDREAPMPPSGTQIPPTQVQPPLSYTHLCHCCSSCRCIAIHVSAALSRRLWGLLDM